MKVFKIIFILAVLLIITAITASVTAQVTIGADDAPQNFSVLELISNNERGLRLPQLTTSQRNTVQVSFGSKATAEAMGLQIFNIDTHCVETWNGTDWISVCGDPFAITPKPVCTDGNLDAIPATVWYPYNLGADPAYDTPKKQIKKLTELGAAAIAGGATGNTDPTDYQLNPAVFGELYQWGRVADGHQKRGNLTVNPAVQGPVPVDDLDANGQVRSDHTGTSDTYYGRHVFSTSTVGIDYNWQPAISSTYTQAKKDSLWGNGQAIDYDFGSSSDGAVRANDGKYYQKPVRSINDPCPSGWRLPTQDEWERLGAYGCGAPNSAAGTFYTNANNNSVVTGASTVPANNPKTTWVRVYNGKASTSTSWSNPDYHATGYAIYNTDVWTAANLPGGYFYGIDWTNTPKTLYDDSAPEPLLFLPATGYRNYSNAVNTLVNVGYSGPHWSSTVNGTRSYYLTLDPVGVGPNSTQYRARGYAVRCVAE